ncbi:MAG: methyltransferase domain-containing protein [Pelagimonas sp.]|jgi:predicted TPR repeat methyltransferase|nr:methyltransferase domain-containing protein [Pelagimonas sp.]
MSDPDKKADGLDTPNLWTTRPVEETRRLYTDWAASYDAELTAHGYQSPRRIAQALAPLLPMRAAPVLDFGCGTGMSGLALRAEGIAPLHGTDITPAMLEQAKAKGIYDALFPGSPGAVQATPGQYRAIVAAGVISLGAAPPDTMDILINALGAGDLLAMSFNDPTLAAGSYEAQLQTHLQAGRAEVIFREHGPHLEAENMGSDVLVVRRL